MNDVTLAFIGDIMLGRGVNVEMEQRTPEYFWGTTLHILRAADAVVGNLECAITPRTDRWVRTPKMFHFRAEPAAIDVLEAGNIRCVSLANNHILDFYEEGLFDTIKYLDEAGISHAGAGKDLIEAAAPAILDVKGLRIGVIAFTDNEPPFAASYDTPGTNYISISGDDSVALERVEESVKRAREAGAQILILSLHWGPNMIQRPPDEFKAFAERAIDMGIDIIHGHSAHIFQGVQRIGRGLVLYDTGDFIDDYVVDNDLRNDWSFIFQVEVNAGGVKKLQMVPVRLYYARADLALSEEIGAIRTRMRVFCSELGTTVTDTSNGLELVIQPE